VATAVGARAKGDDLGVKKEKKERERERDEER
jgi:hypothetical protein